MDGIVHTGSESVEIREFEEPSPGPGEVLIRVGAAGLCGSDANAYLYEEAYEFVPLPRIMGHEYAGTVVEVGSDVTGVAEGDRVVERPVHECGHCFQCRNDQENVCRNFHIAGMHGDGAYTDYRTTRPEYLIPVPEGVPLEHAAITEPTSVAARAVSRSGAQPGDDVLIEGPGPIGVLAAAIADGAGADVTVSGLGVDAEARLPLVENLGIRTINVGESDLADRAAELTAGDGFDVVIDATGHESGVEQGADLVRKGGVVLVVGIPDGSSDLYFPDLVRGEIDVKSSYASLSADFQRALRLMDDGIVDPATIIDESYSRDDPETAITDFLASKTVKPVFRFD
jgi:L-iditol 2-dehydrogenase